MNRAADKRPRDSSASHGQTRFWDRVASARDGGWGGLDSSGTCDAPAGQPPEFLAAASGKAARSRPCLGKSRRVTLEIAVLNLREHVWVALKLSFELVHESRKGRTRTGVADDSFPSGVPIHLGEQRREVLRQPRPVFRGERADCRFDVLNRIHVARVRREPSGQQGWIGDLWPTGSPVSAQF